MLVILRLSFMYRGQDDYSFYELLPMAMLGAIGGLLGMWQLTLFSYHYGGEWFYFPVK